MNPVQFQYIPYQGKLGTKEHKAYLENTVKNNYESYKAAYNTAKSHTNKKVREQWKAQLDQFKQQYKNEKNLYRANKS